MKRTLSITDNNDYAKRQRGDKDSPILIDVNHEDRTAVDVSHVVIPEHKLVPCNGLVLFQIIMNNLLVNEEVEVCELRNHRNWEGVWEVIKGNPVPRHIKDLTNCVPVFYNFTGAEKAEFFSGEVWVNVPQQVKHVFWFKPQFFMFKEEEIEAIKSNPWWPMVMNNVAARAYNTMRRRCLSLENYFCPLRKKWVPEYEDLKSSIFGRKVKEQIDLKAIRLRFTQFQ